VLLQIEVRSSAVLTSHSAISIDRRISARLGLTLIALFLLVAAAPAASARNAVRHKHAPHIHAMRQLLLDVDLPDAGLVSDLAPEDGRKYELKLARQGGEMLDVIYRVGDTYVPEALNKLSEYLRDSHNEEVKDYDPRTFDVLHTMLAKLNRSSSVVEILSAYRTKETNDALRASGTTNAAEFSQHIEATALDIRVPGVPASALRDAALSLSAGGVGYYPKGQFVHVDTGPVREWTYAPHRAELRRASLRRGGAHRGMCRTAHRRPAYSQASSQIKERSDWALGSDRLPFLSEAGSTARLIVGYRYPFV
jgi:uncharacterized protein YcbK (DUF882 family)